MAMLKQNTLVTTPSEGLRETYVGTQKPVPLVVLSALRPSYLYHTLEALAHQHPNTPHWISNSERLLLVHRHELNDRPGAMENVTKLAKQYHYRIKIFNGLDYPKENINKNAKYAWYKMMDYVFFEWNQTQVFIVEDDAVLAPDGLLVAAALLKERRKSATVTHSIVLGGWSGKNRINAHPNTYHMVRSLFFQAMAYSMDRDVFVTVKTQFDALQAKRRNGRLTKSEQQERQDWTEEIAARNWLVNITQLSPSLGRMRHIGEYGMGYTGKGEKRKLVPSAPWNYFETELLNASRTIDSFRMFPTDVTDLYGFVCRPSAVTCGLECEIEGTGRGKGFFFGGPPLNLSPYAKDYEKKSKRKRVCRI